MHGGENRSTGCVGTSTAVEKKIHHAEYAHSTNGRQSRAAIQGGSAERTSGFLLDSIPCTGCIGFII